jgi:hypothetical protein
MNVETEYYYLAVLVIFLIGCLIYLYYNTNSKNKLFFQQYHTIPVRVSKNHIIDMTKISLKIHLSRIAQSIHIINNKTGNQCLQKIYNHYSTQYKDIIEPTAEELLQFEKDIKIPFSRSDYSEEDIKKVISPDHVQEESKILKNSIKKLIHHFLSTVNNLQYIDLEPFHSCL